MRVLALVDRWSRGGVPSVITAHHDMIACEGGDYRLFCYYPPDQDAPPEPGWAEHGNARFRGDPLTLFRLYRKLAGFQPDIIHDHFGGFWAAGYLFRKKWARKALLHYHNEYLPISSTPDTDRSRRDRLFFQQLLPRFAGIITVSEHNRQRMMALTGISSDKITTLANSLDVGVFRTAGSDADRIRKEWNIPESAIVIGSLGRLVYEKGMDTTLEIALRMAEQEDPNRPVHAIIAGSGDVRYELQLHQRSAESGLHQRIHFTGYRTDTADLLAAMDVFLMPSRQEPFGLTVLEAMAMETPVVVVAPEQGGGPLEIVEHGKNGIIVNRRDAGQIAEWCHQLAADEELRNRLIRQAVADLERYKPERIGEKLRTIYRNII